MGLPDALRAIARRQPWPMPAQDASWREARFSVVDIETTGLRLNKDDIISVGAVEIIEGRVSSRTFYEVAKPHRPISEEAMCVHSLTSEDLEGAPPFAEVVSRLKRFVAGSVLVAHAAWIERAFLDRALKPLGERVPDEIVDTAAIARSVLGMSMPDGSEPSLEALAMTLGLPVHTPHHALGDAVTTAQVLLVLATRIESDREGQATVADLLRLSRDLRRR